METQHVTIHLLTTSEHLSVKLRQAPNIPTKPELSTEPQRSPNIS